MNREKPILSLINGYSFSFEFEGHFIKCWFSMLTGLEKVFVDGILVSTNRSLKYKTNNNFLINGESFSTSMNAISFMKGPYLCTLLKNNIPVFKQSLNIAVNYKALFLIFILAMLVGMLFAVASNLMKFPDWLSYVFIYTSLISIFFLQNKFINVSIKEEVCN